MPVSFILITNKNDNAQSCFAKGEIDNLRMQELIGKFVDVQIKMKDLMAAFKKYNESENKNDPNFNSELTLKITSYEAAERDIEKTYKDIQRIAPEFKSEKLDEVNKHKVDFSKSNGDLEQIIKDSIESTSVKIDDDNEVKKSFMFSGLLEKFETLDTYSKIAISLLLLNNALISALISIVFVLYGDYLIKHYNLETRFPRLANIIILRRKFSKYNLILSSSIVVLVILTEVIFSLAILMS